MALIEHTSLMAECDCCGCQLDCTNESGYSGFFEHADAARRILLDAGWAIDGDDTRCPVCAPLYAQEEARDA